MSKADKPAADGPVYRAKAQTYLDRLYEPGDTVTTWDGAPNKALEPLNEAAELAFMEADETRAKRSAAKHHHHPSPAALKAEPAPAPAVEDSAKE
jgi:hypothetical protein